MQTATQQAEVVTHPMPRRQLLLDLGPGPNTFEVENILLARLNADLIAIESRFPFATLLERYLLPTYTDRLEVLVENFGLPDVHQRSRLWGNRKAAEIFAIRPLGSAIPSISNAVQFYLDSPGTIYAALTESDQLERLERLLKQQGLRVETNLNRDITTFQQGVNLIGIKFPLSGELLTASGKPFEVGDTSRPLSETPTIYELLGMKI